MPELRSSSGFLVSGTACTVRCRGSKLRYTNCEKPVVRRRSGEARWRHANEKYKTRNWDYKTFQNLEYSCFGTSVTSANFSTAYQVSECKRVILERGDNPSHAPHPDRSNRNRNVNIFGPIVTQTPRSYSRTMDHGTRWINPVLLILNPVKKNSWKSTNTSLEVFPHGTAEPFRSPAPGHYLITLHTLTFPFGSRGHR